MDQNRAWTIWLCCFCEDKEAGWLERCRPYSTDRNVLHGPCDRCGEKTMIAEMRAKEESDA